MSNYFALILPLLIFLASCKKKDHAPIIPPGNPNNVLNATVSVGGTLDSLHRSSGSSTTFARDIRSNGDTVIVVMGHTGKYGTYSSRQIKIDLINLSTIGTYPFNANISSRGQALCSYQIGDVFFSTVFELYSTVNSNQPGSVTIEALTPTYIQGAFYANCSNYIKISNGTFKGNF